MGLFTQIFRALWDTFCGNPQQEPQSPQQRPTQQYKPSPPVARPPHQQHYEAPQPHYPPPQQKPQQKPHPSPRPSPGPHKNLNYENQQDAHYQSLRTRANDEGGKMAQCFEESHTAYAAGDGARAKELSNEGKAHKAEMERLNAQASEWIFVKNNEDSEPGEVDLHGLYVKEAITYSERAINDARRRGDTRINLIVGKGLHSQSGVAKLKPAIEELIQKQGLVAELDPNNSGVLIVNIDGRSSGSGTVLGADDITHRLQQGDKGCIIM